MAQLAIKGYKTCGKEIIAILEMLGGINQYEISGADVNLLYTIRSHDKSIIAVCPTIWSDANTFVLTLEQFLEKFPYKVGDKVIYKSEALSIIGMKWDCYRNIVIYTMKTNCGVIDCYDNTWMKPYKEETMGEIKIDIPKGYEFDRISNDKQQVVFTKIQLDYPKTYEECCKVVNASPYVKLVYNVSDGQKYSYDVDNLQIYENIRRLKICRDAYWKLAGEQMGLGKLWEPDWNTKELKYIIYYENDKLWFNDEISRNTFLAFPSEEMRDVFYENFKVFIENCKELLL